MGRVGIVLDLVAEFVKGRVCHGPSLLWAEMSRNPSTDRMSCFIIQSRKNLYNVSA